MKTLSLDNDMVTVNQITPIPITSLPAATTLTGNEPLPIVQNTQTVKVPINQLPQGMTAGVITYGNTGGSPFPNYRTLAAGAGITIVDGGAQGAITISVTGGTVLSLTGENYLSLAAEVLTAHPVDLSGSNVTGNLPVSHLNSGTSATASTFWNGDGTWKAVTDALLSTSNITTNNVSISKHGFAPILPNDATKFLNGVGAYSIPSGVGFYPTTMLVTNTGAQNATALTADITAAAGQQIIIPTGQYTLAAVSVSSVDVNLWLETGAILIPDSSLFNSGLMILTTGGAITYNNLTVQGNDNGCPQMVRANTPTFFYAHNSYMYNVGTQALNAPSSTGVYGFIVKGATGPVIIDGWRGKEFNDSNSTSLTLSIARHIFLYNNQFCHVTNVQCEPGSAGTHQVDYIQCLDDQVTHTQEVVIDVGNYIYNQNIRRCIKQSGGGKVKVDKVYIVESPTFTPVSGSTNVGTFNLNAIDYSSNNLGTLKVTNSYIDGTGFATTISNTGGALAQVIGDNCDVIGGVLNVIRNSPDSGSPIDTPPVGFLAIAGDVGSGVSNSRFYGGVGCMQLLGSYNYARNCLFDDPRDYAFQTGNTGVDGFDFNGNKVITRTPGYLSANGYVGQINNVKNISVFNNALYQEGNTTESTAFILVASASATGYAGLNIAPAGVTPFNVGSSAVVNILSNLATTGTGSMVQSVSPTITGTLNAAAQTNTGIFYLNGGVAEEGVPTANTGTSYALSGDLGNFQKITVTGAVTLTFTTPTHPTKTTYIIAQDGTGHVYSMPAVTKWVGGVAPVYSTAANKVDIFSIAYDGTNYYGTSGIAFA